MRNGPDIYRPDLPPDRTGSERFCGPERTGFVDRRVVLIFDINKIWAPKSEIWAPKSEIWVPKSEIWAPKSEIWAPKSKIWAPKSKMWVPKS